MPPARVLVLPRMEMAKMIPPPRRTIVLWLDRSFGLSMMLHVSAILKYTSSATIKIAEIINYVIPEFMIYGTVL